MYKITFSRKRAVPNSELAIPYWIHWMFFSPKVIKTRKNRVGNMNWIFMNLILKICIYSVNYHFIDNMQIYQIMCYKVKES